MKLQYLLIGTSLSLIPSLTFAQCIATQDCETLGYTETSCSGGGVRCPFGNKWACCKSESEIKDQLCTELGFTQTCTGTNQTAGNGKTCNGKYEACYCADGYEWKDDSCQQQKQNGAVGDLYYCDGVVMAVKAPGTDFYVAMQDLGEMTWYDASDGCAAYSFCGNLKGTLPTKEHLLTMYQNKSSLNNLLSANGGTNLTEESYWSSTYISNNHYYVNMSTGSVAYPSWGGGYFNFYVRPVLTSYQVYLKKK